MSQPPDMVDQGLFSIGGPLYWVSKGPLKISANSTCVWVDQGLFSIGGHLSDFLCQYLVNYNDKGLIVKHMKLCRSI